jgi:hypothetical protein
MDELERPGTGSIEQAGATTPAHRESAAPSKPARLKSEDVIINAPMSFAGAFQRTMRLRRVGGLNQKPWLVQALWHWIILNSILIVWWTVIVGWYIVFGIFLIPYRLLRRGARKRKAEALRHREMLGAIDKSRSD